MKLDDFNYINEHKHEYKKPLITIYDLKDRNDRTLLFGYDCDRKTFHVYIKDFVIYCVLYDSKKIEYINIENNEDFIPNKRLYPECCDKEFCLLLINKGLDLPFTTFSERKNYKYYGLLFEEYNYNNIAANLIFTSIEKYYNQRKENKNIFTPNKKIEVIKDIYLPKELNKSEIDIVLNLLMKRNNVINVVLSNNFEKIDISLYQIFYY